jgi:outer membrane receptor protein involved in Fe transport
MFKVWSYPGASSALYGANAFNGILFMTSQSPFTSQFAYAKFGQTSQKLLGQTTMLIMELEWRMRLVQTCRKANFTYLRGTDWYATNYDDKTNVGREKSCEL